MARLAYLTTDNDNNNNNSKPSIREVALLSQQRHPTYKIVIVVYCRGFKSIEVRVILDVFKGFFEILRGKVRKRDKNDVIRWIIFNLEWLQHNHHHHHQEEEEEADKGDG